MALKHDTVTLLRLTAFQRDCDSQELPVECAMAQVVRHAVRFVEAFDKGPRQSWSNHYGSLRHELKLFKEVLKKEFPEIKGNPNGDDGEPYSPEEKSARYVCSQGWDCTDTDAFKCELGEKPCVCECHDGQG